MKNKFVKRSSAFIVGMALSASMVCAPSAGIFGNIAPDTAIVASAVSTSHLDNKPIPSCNSNTLDFKCIDVSYCQEYIDWSKVKASGVDYAIIRCGVTTGGNKFVDGWFKTNYKNAKAAGIKVGLYYYSDATNKQEGIEEANWVIDNILNANGIESCDLGMPIYIDYEGGNNTAIYTMDTMGDNQTEICTSFCDTIDAAGYKAGVYASAGCYQGNHSRIWLSHWKRDFVKKGYSVWVASWGYYAPSYLSDVGGASDRYDVWQYSESGYVNGINKKVDLDVYYHTLDKPNFKVKLDGTNRVFEWDAVEYATKYEVYRDDKLVATVKNNSYKEKAPIVTGSDPIPKHEYYIKAIAGKNSAGKIVSSVSTTRNIGECVHVAAISDLKYKYNDEAATQVTLSWTSSVNANMYRVLKYNESSKKWVKVKDVTGTKATVNTTSKATKYCVKPCYKSGSKVLCGTGSNRVVVSNLSMKNPSFSYTGAYLHETGAKISWSAVDGCKYDVEIVSPDGSKETVPVKSGHSKTISFKQPGAYKVRVRAVNGKAHGKWSGYTEVIAHAISPTNVRITGAVPGEDETKGVATCTWTASKLADGYIISCKNNTTGDIQEIKIESPDETTCTFNVDAGCKYTVTAYSYAIINGVEEKSIVPMSTNYTAPAVFK